MLNNKIHGDVFKSRFQTVEKSMNLRNDKILSHEKHTKDVVSQQKYVHVLLPEMLIKANIASLHTL